jgi:sulfur carrier protein
MGAVLAGAFREAAVNITLNGKPRELAAPTTVEQLVAAVTELASGVAAAVNGEVVPRREWGQTQLRDRDQVEVVTAVQGG